MPKAMINGVNLYYEVTGEGLSPGMVSRVRGCL